MPHGHSEPWRRQRTDTHILEQLDLRRQTLEVLVILALQVVRVALAHGLEGHLAAHAAAIRERTSEGRGPPRGRRGVIVGRAEQLGTVPQCCSVSVWQRHWLS